MFEVVSGIPKSEGMEPPPKIPANPSFVELEEDENAVDKFKRGMASIANALALDRLKQVSELVYQSVYFICYSTVHVCTHSTVQYSTLQYSTIQYGIVQYSTVQYNTVQYSTV